MAKTKTRKTAKPKSAGSVISAEARARMANKEPDEVAKVMASLKGNADALRAFLKANGVWQEKYQTLNSGMVRMNGANRLRALLRKGHKIVSPEAGKRTRRRRKAASG